MERVIPPPRLHLPLPPPLPLPLPHLPPPPATRTRKRISQQQPEEILFLVQSSLLFLKQILSQKFVALEENHCI